MPVLQRNALESSPLADLHAIAAELSIERYRRLRRAELIEAILARQAGAAPAAPEAGEPSAAQSPEPEAEPQPPAQADAGEQASGAAEPEPEPEAEPEPEESAEEREGARRRRRRGGRGRARADAPPAEAQASDGAQEREPEAPRRAGEPEAEAETVVEGVVELLPNGSGFLRVQPPDPSEEDVYISAAQVKRCELITGDRVAGPLRAPRRSERFASLVRIDTVNGHPASELDHLIRYEELAVEFPGERYRLGSEDPTVKAIEWLTPFGRGSRVAIVGAPRSGKSEALRRLLEALVADQTLSCSLVLAGVRPEEIPLWQEGPLAPAAAVSFAASAESQGHCVELAVDQAKRLAARGADAVVAIDTLDGLPPGAARKALAAARKLAGGGSLTVLATASEPLGGETTVISLDVTLTSTGRFPALDLVASGTIRAELLVGEAGAEAIARARAEALESS
jgi:transcription termination factor Rho